LDGFRWVRVRGFWGERGEGGCFFLGGGGRHEQSEFC